MTLDEIKELADKAKIDDAEKNVFVASRYYFESTNQNSVVVNSIEFTPPPTPEATRGWFANFTFKVSELGDPYKDLFICCCCEPSVFLRYAVRPAHEIYLIVEGVKQSFKEQRDVAKSKRG